MQDNTKRSKRIAPVVCAAVAVGLLGLLLAAFIYPLLGESMGQAAVVVFLGVYAAVIVAVIVGIIVALGQRLREIERGEEEDAKRY